MRKSTYLTTLSLLLLTGCSKVTPTSSAVPSSTTTSTNKGCDAFVECADIPTANPTTSQSFKQDYEQYNGQTTKSGKTFRTVSIPDDNPFVLTSPEDVVSYLNNNDSFYLYFGDALCPWCRSVIEVAMDEAKKANVSTIVYVDIWDQDGNETLRDVYELKDGKPTQKQEGTQAYKELLSKLDSVLPDYTLTDDNDQEVSVGEKRVYAPQYIKIVNGKPEKLVTGISDKQDDAYMNLTDDILKDEHTDFQSFFNN